MPYEILLTESFGSDGSEIVYVKPPESNQVSRLDPSLRSETSLAAKLKHLMKEVLLPRGYPVTVSEDYTEYQLWDTVQAFSSTIGHILTTHAVLVGVGVGSPGASALGAAITWIFKDGVGMMSKIAFAWLSGSGIDSNCKKWRLFADVLNDMAMLLELSLLPLLPAYSLQVLCVTSSMKAVVGVAGGATRAAITQHQAISENTGDVSAKDSSQETCVNLLASLFGVLILSNVTDTPFLYPLFMFIMCLHLYSNYRAVQALKFNVLNPERFHIVLRDYLTRVYVPRPEAVAKMESVSVFSGLTDFKLTGFRVKLGTSLQGLNLTSNQLHMISSLYKDKNFMLIQSTRGVHVVLGKTGGVKDLFQAYFHALMLAIASSYRLFNLPDALTGVALCEDAGFKRFLGLLRRMDPGKAGNLFNIEELIALDQFCCEEFKLFWRSVGSSGWSVECHQFHSTDRGWRAAWGGLLASQVHSSFKPIPL